MLSKAIPTIFFFLLLLPLYLSDFLPLPSSLTIGIVSTPRTTKGPTDSYIKESYSEFIQSAGPVTVIPIPWDLEREKFDTLLESVNGVLFTGGDAAFWEVDTHGNRIFNDYQTRLNYIVNFVKQKKYEGVHFPLWAICQGMEAVSIAITHDLDVLDNYIQFGKLATVQFTPKAKESTMFQYFTQDSFTMLEENPAVFYYHEFGLNTSVPEKYLVFTQWLVTGISKDDNGKEFITAMESKDYPIYMHMFHAERVLWEANHLANTKHLSGVIYAIKLLAKSFVTEAAKNKNKFENKELAQALEIENFAKEGDFYVLNPFPAVRLIDGKVANFEGFWEIKGSHLWGTPQLRLIFYQLDHHSMRILSL